jgi:hypothetical protein
MNEKEEKKEEERKPDYVSHRAVRPLKFVKDKNGNGWLCDANVDPNGNLEAQGCWRCEDMAFPTGGR